jgi:serine/threonine protein kinase
MGNSPPANLVQLLARLRLATPEQVAAAAPLARRLAGDLPDFESVWVDALAQRRVLTRWQAAEINAGRADQLALGPYVLLSPAASPHYVPCFSAVHLDSGRRVLLYRSACPANRREALIAGLQELVNRSSAVGDFHTIDDFGTSGSIAWATCPAIEGTPAAAWIVEHGRLPVPAVLQIAREMAERLAVLSAHGVTHGDISAAGLLLQPAGDIALPAPGLRGVVRPEEGYSFAELSPEAYDYLSPERVAGGRSPDTASDLFACGALWWHLLTGRPPFPGGNSLAKLRAVHQGRVVDVRNLAPGVPALLAEAIADCLAYSPADRPASFEALAAKLGPPTPAGRAQIAALLRSPAGSWHNLRSPAPRSRRSKHRRTMLASAGIVAALMAVALGPLYLRPQRKIVALPQSTSAPQSLPESAAAAAEVPLSTPRVDYQVEPAAAVQPAAEFDDVILPVDKLVWLEQLELKPGVHVRGRGGARPLVSVPARGLEIPASGVRFEGIDFVYRSEGPDAPASNGPRALLRLNCQTAFFSGCSFSTLESNPPAAIDFQGTAESLPGLGGELTFVDCVFDGLAAVVDYHARSGLSLRLENCLCVAAGPILRLPRVNGTDEPLSIALDHATLRGDSAVLECRYGAGRLQPGTISISASGCALAGKSRGGLIGLIGPSPPELLLRSLTWNGQGSVVSQHTPVITWRTGSQPPQPIDEDELAMGGLVRGDLEFAGRPDAAPEASRVMHWQAPLRSDAPPGADPAKLHSPRSARP